MNLDQLREEEAEKYQSCNYNDKLEYSRGAFKAGWDKSAEHYEQRLRESDRVIVEYAKKITALESALRESKEILVKARTYFDCEVCESLTEKPLHEHCESCIDRTDKNFDIERAANIKAVNLIDEALGGNRGKGEER